MWRNYLKSKFLVPTTVVSLAIFVGGLLLLDLGAEDDDGDDYDALPGRTDEQIDALIFNFDEVVETIAIYASLMSVLVIILLLALALRLKDWAAYVGLTILSMVWFAFFEQEYTGLYWLGADIGFTAVVIAGFGLASLHLVQAGISIDRDRPFGWAKYPVFGFALGIWLVLALHWPVMDIPPAFVAVATLATFGHLLAVPSFLSVRSATVRVERTGAAFTIIFLICAIAFIAFGEIAEDLDLVFLGRLVLLSVVAFFAVFLVRHAIVLLLDRDARIQRELEAAKHDAEQSRVLLETEQKYSRARDAAQRHTMRLATASHDIRQPLGSLRSTMSSLAKDQPESVRTQLEAALTYLDQLAGSYVDQEEDDLEDAVASPQASGKERVSTEMICATLDRMFRGEAEDRGLQFKASASPTHLHTNPLSVMRILSNLLSNAIKHTQEGQIVLSGRVTDSAYVFSVHNSANLPDDFGTEQMFDPYKKGPDSTGSGLGLSIVSSLSDHEGLSLSWESPDGEGTTFRLAVPLG